MASRCLFSTPTAATGNNSVVIVSSSPEFPSINELISKTSRKPALRSGGNAAPIPTDALNSFTTAVNVLRSSRVDDNDPATEAQRPRSSSPAPLPPWLVIELSPEAATANNVPEPKQKAPKKAAGTRRKKKDGLTAEPATVDSVATIAVPVADAINVEKPAKKPGAKKAAAKATANGQTVLPKGKVTTPAAKEKPSRKKSENVGKHFITEAPAPKPAPKPAPVPLEDEPIALEQAIRRRTSWTPPPENFPPNLSISPSAIKELFSPASGTDQSPKDSNNNVFKTLVDTYTRCAEEDRPAELPEAKTNADVLGKRKLTEMVALRSDKSKTPEASPTKPKAPKKKPRTITDLATAAYRVPEEIDASTSGESSKQETLLGYLGVGDGQPGAVTKQLGKNGKAPKKPAKPRASKKKAETQKQVLLSPKSALSQVAKQDFVFGTASQLATEGDTELLRALHEAMKASNVPDKDPFASSSPVNSDLATRRRVGNKLWAAGARADDGDLLDLEVLDLTESPQNARGQMSDYTLPRLSTVAEEDKEKQAPASNVSRIHIEIQSSADALDSADSVWKFGASRSHFFSTQGKTISEMRQEREQSRSDKLSDQQPPIVTIDLDFEPPPSNQEHNLLLEQSQSSSSPKVQAEGPTRPKYELLTDAQLAKEIASYGFKAVKKRQVMIDLLDKCWTSKHQTGPKTTMAQPLTKQVTSESAAAAPPPPRPRGRPRKDSTVAAAPPSPRARGRPRKDSTTAAAPPVEPASPAKRSRGRARMERSLSPPKATKAKATAALKFAFDPLPPALPTVSTPKRRQGTGRPSAALEIADSESDSDPFASSPMSSPGKLDILSSPPDMDISINEGDTEMSLLDASPTSQQKVLFSYISKAVTTAPRTIDPANPSWHEKMLMYDPIILEDLATWLNSGQLDRVGYDGEVAPVEVKLWCESKSVCCLWRVNLHGKERKRF
ncbi:hypothetical protein B0H63DRAFT_456520 [Podospora didyma]|uniref:Structure-specific endonuclease subunit SLX4 n=1 Tax=Podospora didyma TaxID=330526 RepID=A0AAE0P3M8_9PEZI|nr:hypothetical protein B0H63DRAFT_456520 [Podospora didyma]